MPLDIDGEDARLPSHSQGYCSTHEKPGTCKSSPRDQYSLTKSLPWAPAGFFGWVLSGVWGAKASSATKGADSSGPNFSPQPSQHLPRASHRREASPPRGHEGASAPHALPHSCKVFSGISRGLQGPPSLLRPKPPVLPEPQILRVARPPQTSFNLSEPSAYTNGRCCC